MSKSSNDNPPAISERQPMPRVTIGAVGITIQSDIGGATIAFERLADATIDAADLDLDLDFMMARINRQRAKITLGEQVLALGVNTDMLDNWEEDRDRALKAKAAEHAQLRASFEAGHVASGRRAEFRLNANQQQALDNINQNIETTRTQFDERKASLERDRRIIQKQIKRLRDLIAGRDPVDEPEAEPLSLAAE